ncbi:hypothetical protein JQ596_21590 [Bradyrhizobium manausense]|uniref:hypothetical protein n=1 Tax=Bradyrhizobium TaxID=374 RepID=UPI001BA93F8C|nr:MULTISPECIES: hypothetical protein [Bradyrhizobium]MBR0828133.1 hypothetical protein [Bradyrhizobium manausense]UVO32988.1 hypothetical protein KUF59_21395 [Bradyrhizobium arachidis]
MKHQNQLETRRQNVALKSMSKEAKQLAGLIAGLRKSLSGIDKQRTKDGLSNADIGILDERRNNLQVTIAALEDRLSAVQGLIDLGRPHIIRVH